MLQSQFLFRMKHETDLPAQQAPPQTQIRLPRPHANRRGAQSDRPPPSSRPRTPSRLTFGKQDRLTRRPDFERVKRRGRRLVGRYICIDLLQAKALKLGVTVSTKYGNAVERNRFKRLVRESFRTLVPQLPPGLELHVLPRQLAKGAPVDAIRNEMFYLIHGSQSEAARGRPHN